MRIRTSRQAAAIRAGILRGREDGAGAMSSGADAAAGYHHLVKYMEWGNLLRTGDIAYNGGRRNFNFALFERGFAAGFNQATMPRAAMEPLDILGQLASHIAPLR